MTRQFLARMLHKSLSSLAVATHFYPTSSRLSSGFISNTKSTATLIYFSTRRITTDNAKAMNKASPIPMVSTPTSSKDSADSSQKIAQNAVLRYTPGDERFQLKLTLFGNRVFNFDRSVADSVQTLTERINTNITKKKKKWEGTLDFLLQQGNADEEIVQNKGIPTSQLLEQLLNGGYQLKIKISDPDQVYVYNVIVNPPEIHSIKFHKQVVAGFPILPYKIETSSNCLKEESKYLWEFTRDPPQSKLENDSKNKKKRQQSPGKMEDSKSEWTSTGCTDFVFTPTDEHLGARLRFTCFPSNGSCFGLAFSEEFSDPVSPPPVTQPLYLNRLERMKDSPSEKLKGDANFFRIVSYNCLAECYATEEWFISSPKLALPAEFRIPFLCKEMSSYAADVYCLQEIEDKHFERTFIPFFEVTMGYKGFLSSKTGTVKEGVATIYNPRKLKVLKTETVAISEHMQTMHIWDKIHESVSERVNERNSVLQVSIFEPIAQEKTILIIANTHLYFHPDADHIRLLQTIACVDYLETISKDIKKKFDSHRIAVLFCGDFNCTPPFSSFRYLTSGGIKADDYDWTSHPTEKLSPGFSLEHSLNLTNSHPEHQLTNITTCFEGCLDYILYQKEHFDLLSTYPPPDKDTLASLCEVAETRLVSFPNFYTPSDHLPLISDFLLKSK